MRLSKVERDVLARRDAQILAMSPGANDPQAQAAHLRHMVGLLRNRQASSPCTKAISHLNALYDRSIPSTVSATIACRKGCSHCCSQSVLVYAPEAFCIAARLRDRPETIAAVQETVRRLEGKNPETHASGWTRCPLLDDSACSVYDARPLSCRAFVSLDVNDCIGAFVLMGENRVLTPQPYVSMRDTCRMMLLAALRLSGLPDASYEMNAAVATILTQDNAEKRWLRGEDIFSGLQAVSPPGPAAEAAITRMAAAVGPTL